MDGVVTNGRCLVLKDFFKTQTKDYLKIFVLEWEKMFCCELAN